MKQSENLVLGACCEYLEAKRYFFWRQNNIGVYDAKKKIYRKLPKWSMKGVSDIVCLKNGIPFFIECKTKKGVQSDDQKEFQRLVEENRGVYVLATEIEDLRNAGL